MSKNSLLSMQGSFLLGVDASKSWDIIDLIRAKKAAAGLISDLTYDVDGDGAVTESDVTAIRKTLLTV